MEPTQIGVIIGMCRMHRIQDPNVAAGSARGSKVLLVAW